MRNDNQFLVITHLSQLLNLVTGFAGFIVPLILWLTQRDKVVDMEMQGKHILNFQISMFIYAIICIPLTLLFGLGAIGLGIIAIISILFPILNAIKTSKGEHPVYPMTMNIIK